MSDTWRRRTLGLLAIVILVSVPLAGMRFEVDLPGLVVVVALGLSVVWLAADTAGHGLDWSVGHRWPIRVPGADRRLASHAHLLEDHALAREPGPALRDRLGELAELRLRRRHGTGLANPDAAALLGRETLALLTGPPRRLSAAEIDAILTRIEEL